MTEKHKTRRTQLADDIYSFLLSRNIVSFQELEIYAKKHIRSDYKYLYKQYLFPLLKKKRILRARRGLYYVKNPYGQKDDAPDRYVLASKVRNDYYLGFHSALELYGCAYSAASSCQIAVNRESYFRPFSFMGIEYRAVTQEDVSIETTTTQRDGNKVRLSTPSRTFVDCVHRRDIVGGLEECLKSLDGLGGVSVKGVNAALHVYRNDLLSRSVGFLLETYKDKSPYYKDIKDLESIRERIGKTPLYLEPNVPAVLSKRWNLYVPRDIESLMRGV
jgi:predicted transcriptional regulator of viral defense system